MKRYFLTSLILLGISAVAGAQSVPKGLFHTVMQSSGVVFSGGGTLVKVQVSSAPATQAFNTAWVQYFDTVAFLPAGGAGDAAYTSTQTVTPKIILTSSGTVTIQPGGNGYVIDYGPEGIYVSNGLFLRFGPPVLGAEIGTYWRRDD